MGQTDFRSLHEKNNVPASLDLSSTPSYQHNWQYATVVANFRTRHVGFDGGNRT